VVVKVVVVLRYAMFQSDGLGCLVFGMLFVILAKGMLLVMVKTECGWLWHNGKTGNRTEVVPYMYSGASVTKKVMSLMDNMGM
jgi:hypothetical protein